MKRDKEFFRGGLVGGAIGDALNEKETQPIAPKRIIKFAGLPNGEVKKMAI